MENESEWDCSLNFFMLVHLVMETGAFVLRNLLKKEAPTNSLQCRIHTLLNHPNYKNVRKILNPVQLKLIQGQQPDPEKFDISLTMILLRSICPNIKSPSQGWHGTPNPNDTSLEDDLKRLQDIRNSELLLHSPTTLMTYCTFKKCWEDTTNLIRRLAKRVSNQVADAVETQIQETEQKQFDLSPANKLRLLRILEDNIVTSLHFKQESEDIKRSLKEMLKVWYASF